MKKYINILFGILTLVLVQSCSEELIVDDVIDGVVSGGVLRNLGETNNLDIENSASTYSIILEAQDAQGGSLLSEVRVNVGYNGTENSADTVDATLFRTMPASVFNETSPTTHGLPVATFTASLAELAAHVNEPITEIAAGEEFIVDFEMVLTDGRIFNLGNATGDVTRSGRFSYFNAQFQYSPTVGDPQRLSLDDIRVADDNELGRLSSGDVDTVFLEFDRSTAFVTDPTITILSAVGGDAGSMSALNQMTGDDDNIYYFLYTADTLVADTISFIVADAETTAGLSITTDTLKSAYIIDNFAPLASVGDQSVSLNNASMITNISVDLLFTEELGQDTVDFFILSSQLDTIAVTKVIPEGSESITVDFTPTLGGSMILDAGLEFDIMTDADTISGAGVIDLIGNQTIRTYDVEIFD